MIWCSPPIMAARSHTPKTGGPGRPSSARRGHHDASRCSIRSARRRVVVSGARAPESCIAQLRSGLGPGSRCSQHRRGRFELVVCTVRGVRLAGHASQCESGRPALTCQCPGPVLTAGTRRRPQRKPGVNRRLRHPGAGAEPAHQRHRPRLARVRAGQRPQRRIEPQARRRL
jgi:hypothetical protein